MKVDSNVHRLASLEAIFPDQMANMSKTHPAPTDPKQCVKESARTRQKEAASQSSVPTGVHRTAMEHPLFSSSNECRVAWPR